MALLRDMMFSEFYRRGNCSSKRQVSYGGQQQCELREQARSTLPSTFTTHSLPTRALLPSAGHVGAPGMEPSASPSTAQDKQPQREEKKYMHQNTGIFHR